jgi:hypothetical protein
MRILIQLKEQLQSWQVNKFVICWCVNGVSVWLRVKTIWWSCWWKCFIVFDWFNLYFCRHFCVVLLLVVCVWEKVMFSVSFECLISSIWVFWAMLITFYSSYRW